MKFALESVNAAVWTRDIETDEMEIHPTVCPVFGVTIESLEEWLEEIYPQDRTNAEEIIRSVAQEQKPYSIQFRFSGDDGVR